MKDIKKGLNDEEVLKSREKYGSNEFEKYKKKSFIKKYVSNFSDPIIKVLIIAFFINIAFMFPNINWFESGGILLSVVISTLVSTISEQGNENAFEKLRKDSENNICLVRRNGKEIEIPSGEVVVGDIVLLSAGVKIEADGRVIEGEISVNESALTGESAEVRKNADASSNKLMRGALVCSGSCVMQVDSVGKNTYYGKVASELVVDTRPSPLKHRLSKLAKQISFLGYVAAVMIGFAYLFNVFAIDSHMSWTEIALKFSDFKFVIHHLINALTLAVSVIVVAVPEGLPMMITVVLSSNMKKMMNDNVLVRKLVGIETCGSLNLLFTDKTGTLTEGKLKVREVYTANGENIATFSSMKKYSEYMKQFTLCAGLCNDAVYNSTKALGSDATDRAICEYVKNDIPNATVISKIPFDSTKKYACAVVKSDEKEITLFKGAPEKIINASSSYFTLNGKVVPMTNRESLYSRLRELGGMSYRVVALGMKENGDTSLEKITFIGFVALRDKVRKEVPDAINEITEAGVGVIMITGDNADTAQSIAKECGIISKKSSRYLIITGSELSQMSDAEISEKLNDIAVIARALPSDKSRLVRIAQEKGLTVGMTGDGINDASSLKSADVGFAMGSGTDVAKEAGDIIISDNNFASIVKAVLYGRTIFQSIRKFIVFQLTMNLGAVGISLIGPFIGVENPVTVTQMLWVNIIMDSLGALAFASEPALKEYMKEIPKKRDEPIISHDMARQIISNGIYILILCVWFLKSRTLCMILEKATERYIFSAFFAMFIFTGIFVCFISRTPRLNLFAHLSENKSFILIMLFISVLQMAFIYFGGDVFRATPLSFHDLLSVIGISFSCVIFDFVRKLIEKEIKYQKKKRNVKLKKAYKVV